MPLAYRGGRGSQTPAYMGVILIVLLAVLILAIRLLTWY